MSRTSILSFSALGACGTPYALRISQSVQAAGSAGNDETPPTALCRSCGAAPHDGARFCDKCGSQLSADDTAEYKQVTVLFADVVRSMDIAAVVDIERLREIMTELLESAAAVIRRYGGGGGDNGGGGVGPFWATAGRLSTTATA